MSSRWRRHEQLAVYELVLVAIVRESVKLLERRFLVAIATPMYRPSPAEMCMRARAEDNRACRNASCYSAACCRAAATVRLSNGARLLDANPLTGVRRKRERNPVRPIATWERLDALAPQCSICSTKQPRREADEQPVLAELEETLWVKMELALALAEATGRRLGSIRQLRWEDVDLQRNTIRWRAEFDKKGKDWVVPCPTRSPRS
jgi:integrase